MRFCPNCGSRISAESDMGNYRWVCPTCPYIYEITQKYVKELRLTQKEIEEVISADIWENADKTTAFCPACDQQRECAFKQVQMRSGDEPASIFYRCLTCAHNWRED